MEFHPRFDAIAKTYRYRLFRAPLCPPFEWRYVHHYPYPLDETAMREAAEVFKGEHDFTSFAAADNREDGGKSHVRRIFHSELVRSGDALIYTGPRQRLPRNLHGPGIWWEP